ncbi:MAG: helix-turn-helix domain-containing protein [Prevotella sp.]|nr:helix-turn-helix domain-containing protein [Prevotella sp.]
MKQKKQQVIPIHRMGAQASLGMEFSYFDIDSENEFAAGITGSDKNMVHRDDYYLFMFLTTEEVFLTVDFEEVRAVGDTVFYVRPGQVHGVPTHFRKTEGWFLAIDSMLVEKEYRNTFEGQILVPRPITLDASVSARMSETARLLHATMQAKPTAFSNGIILNLVNVFIGIIAEQYAGRQENLLHLKSRSALITYQFKELLSGNFKTLKSPIQYAEELNYSLSHLNESVRNITGFPISYWIHQQVIMEAKRLLYYTDMDVREIAFSLGYEDHTYFSRLFSKVAGIPPGAFRRKFRE